MTLSSRNCCWTELQRTLVSSSQTGVDGDSNPGLCPPRHQPSKRCHRQEAVGRPVPTAQSLSIPEHLLWTGQQRRQQRGRSPWQLAQLAAEGPHLILLPILRTLILSMGVPPLTLPGLISADIGSCNELGPRWDQNWNLSISGNESQTSCKSWGIQVE